MNYDNEFSLKHFQNVEFSQVPKPPIAQINEGSLSTIHSQDNIRNETGSHKDYLKTIYFFKGKKKTIFRKTHLNTIDELLRASIFQPIKVLPKNFSIKL